MSSIHESVAALLGLSPSFTKLPADQKDRLRRNMEKVGLYLAQPESFPANSLPGAIAFVPAARADRKDVLAEVNFPSFAAALIQGVFHAVVNASIEQMEAYADLLGKAAASVDKFRDEVITDESSRDWLTAAYPDVIENDSGCLRLRKGIALDEALRRLKLLGLEGGFDGREFDKTVVAAGRQSLAKGRQQLLATMVLMG